MVLKVTWKKGMRLTAEVFDSMDRFIEEGVRGCYLAATDGRFGLLPSSSPFQLSVDFHNNILEVVSLSCKGITKCGSAIDINFDSAYSKRFDTRVMLPDQVSDPSLILTIKLPKNSWREVDDTFSEPAFKFELIGENREIDECSLPIGKLVNKFGWRLEESDFVPPCIFVDAHHSYFELYTKIKAKIKNIYDTCLNSSQCAVKILLSEIWKSSYDIYSTLDKELYGMTPERLFSLLQKMVNSMIVGAAVEPLININDPQAFMQYCAKPLNIKNLYEDILQGLQLCDDILVKINNAFKIEAEKPREEPVVKPKPEINNKKSGKMVVVV